MRKCIITVVGRDQVGIIAKVCNYLAEANINVLDISQTIVDGYFNMMMVADVSAADRDFSVYTEDLGKLGESMGLNIRCQRSEIFEKMHRL